MNTGRIYGYRFRPEGNIKGKTINDYEGKCIEARAFQVMIEVIFILMQFSISSFKKFNSLTIY